LQGKDNSLRFPLLNLKLIPYRSYRNYLKSKFGKPVLKVLSAVDSPVLTVMVP
jgi:hypothetical protein